MYQGEVKFIPPCLNFFEVIILMGHVELQNYSSLGKKLGQTQFHPTPPFPRITVKSSAATCRSHDEYRCSRIIMKVNYLTDFLLN